MVLETSGDTADFKTTVKSLAADDIVTVSEGTTSMANKTVIKHGQKTVAVAGTREQMPAQAIPDGYSVLIRALNGNGGLIYVGDVTVDSSNGQELAKDAVLTLKIDNLNRLYLDSSVNGEGVSWIVESD